MTALNIVEGTQLACRRAVRSVRGYNMKKLLHDFCADETAATAIEYGLIATGIAIAIITAVKGVGTKLSTTFTTISTSLK
jgi:pilus assembly protein Flp/PilA